MIASMAYERSFRHLWLTLHPLLHSCRVLLRVDFKRESEVQAARDAMEYAVAKIQAAHPVEVGGRQEQRRCVLATLKPLGGASGGGGSAGSSGAASGGASGAAGNAASGNGTAGGKVAVETEPADEVARQEQPVASSKPAAAEQANGTGSEQPWAS